MASDYEALKLKARARYEALKLKVRARLAAALDEKAKRKLAPPPRYDAEFFEGIRWLDSLAGEDNEPENPHGK